MAKYDEDEYYEERPRKKSSSGSKGSGKKSSGSKGNGKKSSGSKGSGKKSSGKKSSSKKQQAKKQRRRIIIFIIEIIILLVAVFVLYGIMTATKSGKVDLDEEKIIINSTVKEAQETTMRGYRNIALFGVDSTSGALTKNT